MVIVAGATQRPLLRDHDDDDRKCYGYQLDQCYKYLIFMPYNRHLSFHVCTVLTQTNPNIGFSIVLA